jgi:hypothetical protein
VTLSGGEREREEERKVDITATNEAIRCREGLGEERRDE